MGDGFYGTLTDLVRLGSAGVGIAVFLMVFILLMRGKPMDEATARLREKFLIYGVGFAVFCGIASFISPFFEKEVKAGGPVKLRLAFSPDFGTESLTPPKVQLTDGSNSEPGKAFNIPGNTSLDAVFPIQQQLAGKNYKFIRMRISFQMDDTQSSSSPVPYVDQITFKFDFNF